MPSWGNHDWPLYQVQCKHQILHLCVCLMWKQLLFYNCCSCHSLWGLVFINILKFLWFNTIAWSECSKMTWAGPIQKFATCLSALSQGRSHFTLLAWHDFLQQHSRNKSSQVSEAVKICMVLQPPSLSTELKGLHLFLPQGIYPVILLNAF